ncbi:hypothetical protein ACFQU1_18200 [Chelatococcus sp. GCM10030263]|uniref:hypothetical protein n=1 Tax=Chelatococcus sp. GCM10030263 TaxID=3273387 RepID=UPI003619A386
MLLLSDAEIEQIAGGDALCQVEVGIWGAGLGAMIGTGVGLAINPLLGLAIGAVIAGSAMVFAPDTLCRGREVDTTHFPYIN